MSRITAARLHELRNQIPIDRLIEQHLRWPSPPPRDQPARPLPINTSSPAIPKRPGCSHSPINAPIPRAYPSLNAL